MNYIEEAAHILRPAEGFRPTVYKDSVDVLTVGYGHNLESNAITISIANSMLYDDIASSIFYLKKTFPNFHTNTNARKTAMICMMFQLGPTSFQEFKKFIKHAKAKRWHDAAKEMLDSKWGRNHPERVLFLSRVLNYDMLKPPASSN